ncbi:hypothetical protein C7974DRAFT_169493 [Boeremia exigua]|uniref:uncharacterized protein n=1 Tax=Boeremia exigua TaxID=749465 RepID=UPI001E8CB6EC|nr:uncharacterized protein C7974DRAFT_169493 [Boeremia exigua]KAH6633328.1 hypothetical protein C7974DRAFT_169493 [Boeremia exigua]
MRLKLLSGAPLREHLDFSTSILSKTGEHRNFGIRQRYDQAVEEEATFKWRDIGAKGVPLRTGWSPPYLPGTGIHGAHDGVSFVIPGVQDSSELPEYNVTNLETTLTLDEENLEVDNYLQHSLVFYDTLLSSQIVQDIGADETVPSSSFLTTSFNNTTSEFSSPSPVDTHAPVLQVSPAMVVTSLESLPDARHLRSIYPQTLTPNFLCAVMTTPERNEVLVRKGGYRMDLWEITVGDDTRSGFKVTFWLRPSRDSNNEQKRAQVQLLHVLEHLQVGDIILLRNIALTSFREIVYGQSLNATITRARTSLDVLVKSNGMPVAQLGGLPALVGDILTKVKKWARYHVAGERDMVKKRKGGFSEVGKMAKRSFTSSACDEDLPPDTMESPQGSPF